MTNQVLVELLKRGIGVWNSWREENLYENLDFRRVQLSGSYLSEVDFSHANFEIAYLSSAKLSCANLEGINLNRAYLGGADLYSANLRGANLIRANFNDAHLKEADLTNANLSGAHLRGANLLNANLSGALLSRANLENADLSYANLENADLSYANLENADLSHANLKNADLSSTHLKRVIALDTSFLKSTLTGICIQDWNININTNFDDVICEYFFRSYNPDLTQPSNRHPLSRNFDPGEFAILIKMSLETIDLIFVDGIDWQAFLQSFQDLRSQFSEQEIAIQAIEKKGTAFVVRLETRPEADKNAIEAKAKELYSGKLLRMEQKYKSDLLAKESEIAIYKKQSAVLLEIVKLQATRPIAVEATAVAEKATNQTKIKDSTIGAMHSGSGNITNFSQAIGSNLHEITKIIKKLKKSAKNIPEEYQEDLSEDFDDLVDAINNSEKRTEKRLRKRIMALWAIVCAIAVGVAGATDFSNNLVDLAQKLNVPLTVEVIKQNPHVLQEPNQP
ncbi:pentapeptide repeat-containing protein [Acaryochloris marina]|nr:pentapeptide repeat-containing protein [Acaryochloris marina]